MVIISPSTVNSTNIVVNRLHTRDESEKLPDSILSIREKNELYWVRIDRDIDVFLLDLTSTSC